MAKDQMSNCFCDREIDRMLPERIYRPEIFFVVSLGFVSQRKRGRSTPRRSLKGLRPSGKNWYGSATRKCVASRRS